MPVRSPLTAAARQRSRRPARHVVFPVVWLFSGSISAMTARHGVFSSFAFYPAILIGLIVGLRPQLQCNQLVHKR